MKRTKNPKIWFQYLCWKIVNWMDTHKPYYPLRVRIFILRHYPETRFHMTKSTWERWAENSDFDKTNKDFWPLPWFIGESALGPFIKPWNKLASFVRRFRGNHAHRCDFTDPKNGLLYGGDGETMNNLWHEFMRRINYEDN